MDRNLKTLVAVACVAIIAAVGYFFWGEWSEARAVAAARQSATEAVLADRRSKEEELFRLASAEPEQRYWVTAFCQQVLGGAARVSGTTITNADERSRLVQNCRALGYL